MCYFIWLNSSSFVYFVFIWWFYKFRVIRKLNQVFGRKSSLNEAIEAQKRKLGQKVDQMAVGPLCRTLCVVIHIIEGNN